jgi:transcriptional regulator with XRE-family HTH domain
MRFAIMIRRKNLNTIIKDKRIGLGFSQQDLAKACGITEHEYRDLEDYEDEIYTVVQLSEIECVCGRLGVNLADLFCSTSVGELLPKDIIDKRMKEKKISTLELSDLIGIEESYIDAIKKNIVKIGDWVMDPVYSLSEYLDLNLGRLLKSFVEYRREMRSSQ